MQGYHEGTGRALAPHMTLALVEQLHGPIDAYTTEILGASACKDTCGVGDLWRIMLEAIFHDLTEFCDTLVQQDES